MLTSDWIEKTRRGRRSRPKARSAIRLHGFSAHARRSRTICAWWRQPRADGWRGARPRRFARALARQGRASPCRRYACAAAFGLRRYPLYSFGRRTWLYDLFTKAGFHEVETAEKILPHQAGPGGRSSARSPDRGAQTADRVCLRTCERRVQSAPSSHAKTGVRIVNLDGEQFLHPAPVLLDGLDTLIARRAQWRKTP